MRVVIRWVDVFKEWYICHEKSYQNAFRYTVNGFITREGAIAYAKSKGCVVVFHEYDRLQQENQNVFNYT